MGSLGNNKGNSIPHYFISQSINFIWLILVWIIVFYAVQPENLRKAIEEQLYFIFLYIFIGVLMYFTCWRPKIDCQPFLICLGVTGICGGGIFIGIFYGVYYKPLNYTYLPAQDNCKITSQEIINFNDVEKYTALTVQFTDEKGNQLNGYGCASTRKQDAMVQDPIVYMYYERGETLMCKGGQTEGGSAQIIDSDVLNNLYYANDSEQDEENDEQRILQENNIYHLNQKHRQLKSYTRTASKQPTACEYKQDFVDVKLPAWHCKEYDQYIEDISNKNEPLIYKKCYYTIYGDKNKAQYNALNSTSIAQEMKDFYMITFENPPYYDKLALQLIIVFCLIPFLSFTHFTWIPYVATIIEPKFFNIQNNQQQVEPQDYDKNNQNQQEYPFQQHQTNMFQEKSQLNQFEEKTIEMPVLQTNQQQFIEKPVEIKPNNQQQFQINNQMQLNQNLQNSNHQQQQNIYQHQQNNPIL